MVRKAAMQAFGLLPAPLRRLAVRLGTPSYTVGAVLVLRRPDGRFLMVDQRHSGGWALPGGLLRRGERPADGVVREVAEEVGIHLDADDLPVPTPVVAPRARRVDLVYVLDADEQQARREDPAEVRRIGWFTLDELPDISEPTLDILGTIA
ncbi:MAG TPA: NUDIX hydrolase [Mycobacteriales bacterium]|nr:NUDIX hydrolase [Mycobacteriales bacterium]